jgi:hypothetical protein
MMQEPPIVPVIRQLHDIGFFTFWLPFFLTSSLFYALLRKSEILGPPERNVATNAVLALGAAFFVWSAPILLGVDITTQLVAFFAQSLGTMLVFMIALLMISMIFPPNLPDYLSKTIKVGKFWGGLIVVGVLVGVLIFGTSGLLGVLFKVKVVGIPIPPEILWTIAVVGVMILIFLAIVIPGG